MLRTALAVSLLVGWIAQPQLAQAQAAGAPPQPTSAQGLALKDAYAGAFRVGVALGGFVTSGRDPASLAIVESQFNSVTAENSMKAEPLNPAPGVWNFGQADALVEYGETHDLFIVGHTLIWHNQTPAWFFVDENGAPNTPAAQIERMRQHIEAVAGRYAGRVDGWDVVNEVIADDGGYRPTRWVEAVGDGDLLVREAFRFAELFGIFYRHRDAIDRVTFWGIHDGASWKNNYPVPGRTNYPLLFDRERAPKLALERVLEVPATLPAAGPANAPAAVPANVPATGPAN